MTGKGEGEEMCKEGLQGVIRWENKPLHHLVGTVKFCKVVLPVFLLFVYYLGWWTWGGHSCSEGFPGKVQLTDVFWVVDSNQLQLNLLRHTFFPTASSFIADAAAILLLPVSTMSLTSINDLLKVHGNIKAHLTPHSWVTWLCCRKF